MVWQLRQKSLVREENMLDRNTPNRARPCGFLIRKLLEEGHDPLHIDADLRECHSHFTGIDEPTNQVEAGPVEHVGQGQFESTEVQAEDPPVKDKQVTIQRLPFEPDDSDDDSIPDLANYFAVSGPFALSHRCLKSAHLFCIWSTDASVPRDGKE
jgi:hypothetical protein